MPIHATKLHAIHAKAEHKNRVLCYSAICLYFAILFMPRLSTRTEYYAVHHILGDATCMCIVVCIGVRIDMRHALL